jgi:PAS domain S-box-containing protein
MEILLPALVLVLFVLLALVLVAPGLVVVFALALPVAAMIGLVRLLRPQPRRAEPAIDRTARATLNGAGATSHVGIGAVPDRLLRETPHPQYQSRRQGGLAPTVHLTPVKLQAIASEFRSDEALFAFDRDLTVVSWNKGAAELTGIPAEEALGRHCWELLGGVDAAGNPVCHAGCQGAQLASQGSPINGQPLLIKTATGDRRAAWLSTIAVRGGDEPLTMHLLRNGPEVEEESGQPKREPIAAVN